MFAFLLEKTKLQLGLSILPRVIGWRGDRGNKTPQVLWPQSTALSVQLSDGLSNESKHLNLGYSLRIDIEKIWASIPSVWRQECLIHWHPLLKLYLFGHLFKMQVTWIPVDFRGHWCDGDLLAACCLITTYPGRLCWPSPQSAVLWYQFYPHGRYENAVAGNEERGCTQEGEDARACAFFLLLPGGGSSISLHWPQPSFHFLRTLLPFSTALYSRNLTWVMSKMPWALVDFLKRRLILFHYSTFPKILH